MVRETTIFSEWPKQKHNKGWLEGKVEGEMKGKHTTWQRLLEKRFGELAFRSQSFFAKIEQRAIGRLNPRHF